ncbi:hypothetical protein H6P81_002262 [Aristolochia fimbriata]|uniref:Uncharacterized protein n=1 Tax=Aristolochia fimbriata TaxID=158543 RepID=A0AAV7F9V0_ARIFI|nr:hypothetical protein H6P81_002262 [Aristolochia fimbriata]
MGRREDDCANAKTTRASLRELAFRRKARMRAYKHPSPPLPVRSEQYGLFRCLQGITSTLPSSFFPCCTSRSGISSNMCRAYFEEARKTRTPAREALIGEWGMGITCRAPGGGVCFKFESGTYAGFSIRRKSTKSSCCEPANHSLCFSCRMTAKQGRRRRTHSSHLKRVKNGERRRNEKGFV